MVIFERLHKPVVTFCQSTGTGPVSDIVGAKKELAAAVQELDQARVKEFLRAKDCHLIHLNMNVSAA